MTGNDLGDFLRAHRARVRPDDAGLASYGRRRVPGLRREEVAVLAGMNTDYYARLEQGRERRPSPQMLEAISRALRLDEETRAHLFRLAGAVPDHGARSGPTETVSPDLRRLLDSWVHTPAFVLDPALEILTANDLATALFSPFRRADNLARMTFLDPAARGFHSRWEDAARSTVAALRESTGLHPDHRLLNELVEELTGESEEFNGLWRSHTVRGKTHGAKELLHPDVGRLSLDFQSFDVRGTPGRQVVIYHAEPGSRSADRLALLGTLGATWRQSRSALEDR
ncbi:helix-turn-helix transcriptional regulator [Streptomyces sp. NPDC048639]|uniref:helix-turn-helix transcriptional regulator n=1 Tax=Streptomyces sp. NPDC048639 TaxID=3365581 RepID=UPI00370FF6D1